MIETQVKQIDGAQAIHIVNKEKPGVDDLLNIAFVNQRYPRVFLIPREIDIPVQVLVGKEIKEIFLDALRERKRQYEKEKELFSPGGMYAELVGNVYQNKLTRKIYVMQKVIEFVEKKFE